MTPLPDDSRRSRGLDRLRELLLGIDVPGHEGIPRHRDRFIEEAAALAYFARREVTPGLPRLVVIFGPSGGGKSTIFNLLIGSDASYTSSVERPATKGAVIAAPPDVVGRMGEMGLFPTFQTRIGDPGGESGAGGVMTLVARADGPEDLVLIDSPDYDTKLEENRSIAERLLFWADRVLFVTSVERYADRSARPYLERLRQMGVATLFVLNKVEGDAEPLLPSFREIIAQAGGPRADLCPLPRADTATLRGSPRLVELRAFIADERLNESFASRTALFVAGVRREVALPVRAWEDRRTELLRGLDATRTTTADLPPHQTLDAMSRFEDESKFWLRYSHRSVLRGIGEVFKNPRRFFSLPEMPGAPADQAVSALVLEQATDSLADVQSRSRECMKRFDLGREFVRHEFDRPAELSPDAIAEHFRPLVEELVGFSRTKMDSFRAEWAARSGGALSRARFWAIDKVFKLVTLSLTLAVLPPLVHELLRFIGVESFTNEVKAELARAQASFRRLQRALVARQLDSYRDAIRAWGPSPDTADRLERLLDELGAASGGDGT